MTVLTDRFTRAVDYARIAHAAQVRKGTDTPYITHLLGVATLVVESGGNEDQAIAGLLHDTIEDCGKAHESMIRAQFGNVVADIVVACTDGTAEGKSSLPDAESRFRDWVHRKRTYLSHLEGVPDEVLLVSACDKLHNALAIIRDLENPAIRMAVFERFKGGVSGTLGYYESIARILSKRQVRVAPQLEAAVGRMHDLAGSCERRPLNR